MPISPRFIELLSEIEEIHRNKTEGYSGDSSDPFINIKASRDFGVSPFIGCLIRMGDKFSRIKTLSTNPEKNKVGESIIDTLLDLSVYSLIAICLYEEENEIKLG